MILAAVAGAFRAGPARPALHSFNPSDRHTFAQAELLTGKVGPVAAGRRLVRAGKVSSAALGRDGKTLELRFADGAEAVILPPALHGVRVPLHPPRPRVDQLGSGKRAVVLEPFQDELALGPPEGDGEAQALRSAGFDVTRLSNGDVNVAVMATLSQYNVVYMLTHSGVLPDGDGIIATGQVATPDPYVQPFYDDHSVIITGVSGTNVAYFGVVGKFFALHSGPFPPNAFMFISACTLLQAPTLFQTLRSKGVQTLVSWSADVVNTEQPRAAIEVLTDMSEGQSVKQAVANVIADGHGSSEASGQLATLGYLGNGDLTLHDVLFAPPATATPLPTDTPLPTVPPTPTSTPAPTATSTPRPTVTPLVPGKFTWPDVPSLKQGTTRWQIHH
jgi:hypothetical protein